MDKPQSKESNGYHVCRIYHPYGLERYAIAQDYTARYLTADGEWDRPIAAIKFGTRAEAEAFAQEHLIN